jgi:hypothetical protein
MDQIQMDDKIKAAADLNDLNIETFQTDELTELSVDAAFSIQLCSSTSSATCCG